MACYCILFYCGWFILHENKKAPKHLTEKNIPQLSKCIFYNFSAFLYYHAQ